MNIWKKLALHWTSVRTDDDRANTEVAVDTVVGDGNDDGEDRVGSILDDLFDDDDDYE